MRIEDGHVDDGLQARLASRETLVPPQRAPTDHHPARRGKFVDVVLEKAA